MTLLIDPPGSPGHGRLWSHLASDTSFEELHAFAARLGIPRRGFDRDHYDIPAERYHEVVAAGATPVPSRELVDRLVRAGLRRRRTVTPAPRRPGRPLLRPPRLRPGDTVAVVAPSGPVQPQRLEAGVAVLESWGLSVRVMPGVLGRHDPLGYLSGPDDVRAAELVDAWTDPDVRAVFCARGGYGAQRLLDLLDWSALASVGPKVLVGFSDVTALHQAFGARLGLSTVHGPVVTSLGAGSDEARRHLRTLLFEPERLEGLTPEPVPVLVPGRASGVLAGGTVTLLAASAGTPDVVPARGAVVVLEDVGEQPYRLDRSLTQLLRTGWFEGVRGVALGAFTGCGSDRAVRDVLLDRLGPLGVPVLCGLPVGHVPDNRALPLGVPATLDADAVTGVGTLTVEQRPLL